MVIKRFSITLISLLLVVLAFAANKNLEKDITMVSYEQSWLDNEGTLAVKNNTNEEVRNLVFVITYLDMSGNELDYKEFYKYVSINPGMTRKLDIPAYEHKRRYHYYKTKDEFGHPAFKIKFKLKDYNMKEDAIEDTKDDTSYRGYNCDYDSSTSNDRLYIIIATIVMLFVIGISIGLYVLVAVMAQKRNRSVVVWVLLSILATPLLMIIILLVIGKDEDCAELYYNEE